MMTTKKNIITSNTSIFLGGPWDFLPPKKWWHRESSTIISRPVVRVGHVGHRHRFRHLHHLHAPTTAFLRAACWGIIIPGSEVFLRWNIVNNNQSLYIYIFSTYIYIYLSIIFLFCNSVKWIWSDHFLEWNILYKRNTVQTTGSEEELKCEEHVQDWWQIHYGWQSD